MSENLLPTSDNTRLRAARIQFGAALMQLLAAIVRLFDHHSRGDWL